MGGGLQVLPLSKGIYLFYIIIMGLFSGRGHARCLF